MGKEAANLELGSAAFEEATERIRKAQSQFREFRNDTKAKEVKDQFNDLAGGVSSSFDIAETSLKSFGVEFADNFLFAKTVIFGNNV